MAGTTKEAQRAELHKTILRIANDLRGGVDGWETLAGELNFDYTELTHHDTEFGRKDVGKRAHQDANLNETIAAIFKNIEGSASGTGSEDDFKGLFADLDVNSSKAGQLGGFGLSTNRGNE